MMINFIKIIRKMYWLGLIGVIGTIFDIKLLKLFCLFFLLSILDITLSLINISLSNECNTNVTNLKFLFQNIGLLISIPIIYIRNKLDLPSIQNYKPSIIYSLPFTGHWTVAKGGVVKETSHSWSICNQRYAYDFYMEESDATFKGQGNSVEDYLCYGKPIIAPADGIVIKIINIYIDTPISNKHEIACNVSDIRGNYIVIRHSDNEYSSIFHIMKDSFCVNVGDKIYRGQLIASVGNSGNTSEPHIHFQVQQSSSFLLSASLPISFINIKKNSVFHSETFICTNDIVENKDWV